MSWFWGAVQMMHRRELRAEGRWAARATADYSPRYSTTGSGAWCWRGAGGRRDLGPVGPPWPDQPWESERPPTPVRAQTCLRCSPGSAHVPCAFRVPLAWGSTVRGPTPAWGDPLQSRSSPGSAWVAVGSRGARPFQPRLDQLRPCWQARVQECDVGEVATGLDSDQSAVSGGASPVRSGAPCHGAPGATAAMAVNTATRSATFASTR
jgi:hypothetical protein